MKLSLLSTFAAIAWASYINCERKGGSNLKIILREGEDTVTVPIVCSDHPSGKIRNDVAIIAECVTQNGTDLGSKVFDTTYQKADLVVPIEFDKLHAYVGQQITCMWHQITPQFQLVPNEFTVEVVKG